MATSAGQYLARTPLFKRAVTDWGLSQEDRLALTHQRAKAIASTFGTRFHSVFEIHVHELTAQRQAELETRHALLIYLAARLVSGQELDGLGKKHQTFRWRVR